jgi:tRNA pseudouridine38-40 synthase
MRKIALRLAYDGTDFVGSQWQTNGRSVQGELESAWTQLTQEQQRVVLAGRTDAGVHAQGQVAHVVTATRHAPATIRRALNALLPHDAAVLDAWEVSDAFHARYSARWRKYRYLVDASGQVPLPLLRSCVLHVGYELDTEAVQRALDRLIGEHDFAAFASVQGYDGPTVRCCYQAGCEIVTWFDRPLLAIDMVANGFLRHMVRTIVGTMLLVGQHRLSSDTMGQILESRDRRRAGPTAPAHGLMLLAVGYPAEVVSPEMQEVLGKDNHENLFTESL